MTDNKKLLSENKPEGANLNKADGELYKSESVFASSWLRIQKEFKELKKEDDQQVPDEDLKNDANEIIGKKKKDKSKKGKDVKLSDKVSSADIKDWFEHKRHIFSFMEYLKTIFKTIDGPEIQYSFGPYYKENQNIKKSEIDLLKIDENDIPSMKIDDNVKKEIETLGNQMVEHYIQKGLSNSEAERRKLEFGPNFLPEKKKTPEIIKFLHEITNVFSNMLWIACILAFIGYALTPYDLSNLFLGIVIILIIILTGFLSYYQNNKSEAIMESIKQLSKVKVLVIREPLPGSDKHEQNINSADVVIGDVLPIKTGQKIPADLRVIKYNDFKLDNSSLTGESVAIEAKDKCGEAGIQDPLHAKNIAYFSTLCKDGNGIGIVIKTGPNTYMGKIADLTQSAEGEATTLQHEMNLFIWKIAILAFIFGVVFFVMGIIVGYPLITNFIFAIGMVIANVPEGLMSTMTICLTIAAYQMYNKNVMVKNLQSVETLGAITCICSDKTGTLTQNKMTVVHLWYDKQIKKTLTNQENIRIDREIVDMSLYNKDDPSFFYMKFAGVCGSSTKFLEEIPDDFPDFLKKFNEWKSKNHNATDREIDAKSSEIKGLPEVRESYRIFYENNISERMTNGDASESGIIKFFEGQEPIEEIRRQYPIHSIEGDDGKKKDITIPFNSTNKFAAFLRRSPNPQDGFLLAIKGAPERIEKRCTRYIFNGKEFPIDQNFQEELKKANKCFALKGERVIGLAYARLNPEVYHANYPFEIPADVDKANFPLKDLCFVGLVAMEDPPRVGVKNAIAICKKAGVKVIMVTGDQTLTAASIAYQIGIIENLDDTPEIIKEEKGLSTIEEAENFSQTIIIPGDRLYAKFKEDELLSESNPQKGAYLRKWLMKRDVVFARTSPDQKLIIVDGCQKLSHVVAVTGDGVNDSPAIKKSDIGIAMGKVGTDVAKEAADILLLDDNFANIVKGIKRGRIIFDCLKKVTGYNLTSNVTELIPFVGFVIFQFPLPLTTIAILCMDVFSNIYPNISLASEGAEEAIMERKPRNLKTDRLCTIKLFALGYLFLGFIECAGAFMGYWVSLYDYGFYALNSFFLANANGFGPTNMGEGYMPFNPYDQDYFGNSYGYMKDNVNLLGLSYDTQKTYQGFVRVLDYTIDQDLPVDYRVFYFHKTKTQDFWGKCRFDSVNLFNGAPVCYSGEAIRHAQGAYLAGMVMMQTINGLNFRTISQTIYNHKLNNWNINFAYFVEISLIAFVIYTPGLNSAFGFRSLRWEHFAIPSFLFWVLMFFYDELRKLLVRSLKKPDGSPGWFYEYFFY